VKVLAIAQDILREALVRKWVLALASGMTLLIALAALGLQLEVVDGALAASRFFGGKVAHEIRATDVALRPLFEGISYAVFHGGIVFGIMACADFAPALFAPGRIEHLLSLPIRRRELVVGVFLGVESLVLSGALYGGAGLSLVIWAKTGVLSWGPMASSALAALGFASVYAVMVLSAVVVRSAALSALAGFVVFIAGLIAGNRNALSPLFSAGPGRGAFLFLTAPLPHLSSLARVGALVAEAQPVHADSLAALLTATIVFALALLALAIALFERKDY
jgi:ABC-type transport system involved in multi-copper enzyme maturation permease subunit